MSHLKFFLCFAYVAFSFKGMAMYDEREWDFSAQPRPTPFQIAHEIELQHSMSNLSHARRPHPIASKTCHVYSLDPPPLHIYEQVLPTLQAAARPVTEETEAIYEEIGPITFTASCTTLEMPVTSLEGSEKKPPSKLKKYLKKSVPVLLTAGIMGAVYWGVKSYLDKQALDLMSFSTFGPIGSTEEIVTTVPPFTQETP